MPANVAEQRIVLVGRRRAAVRAVRALGFQAVQIAREPRALQAARAFGGDAEQALAQAREALGEERPAAVIAVAEGAVPAAAAIRERYGLAGLAPAVALRCHDKLAMKRALAAGGVRCAPWLEVGADSSAEALVDALGLPVVLKVPVSSGGRGVRVARSLADVAALARPGMLAEGFVDGVEMSVETLLAGGRALFRNPTRYLEPAWANLVPAPMSPGTLRQVVSLVEAAHGALDVDTGITHSEVFLTRDGPVFGEVAARPPGGLIMELIQLAYGFDPWRAIVEIALGRSPSLPPRANRWAAVRVLHPGAGTVAEVGGVDAARAIPGVHRVTVTVSPGDAIEPRLGTGQSVGHVVAVADDPDECARRLTDATRAIRVELAR